MEISMTELQTILNRIMAKRRNYKHIFMSVSFAV